MDTGGSCIYQLAIQSALVIYSFGRLTLATSICAFPGDGHDAVVAITTIWLSKAADVCTKSSGNALGTAVEGVRLHTPPIISRVLGDDLIITIYG